MKQKYRLVKRKNSRDKKRNAKYTNYRGTPNFSALYKVAFY